MVATVIINEKNGAGEVSSDKTGGTIRFKNVDNAVVDTNNPLVIPATGSDWSFEKWLRLNVSGTFTEISNLKFYMDGANNFGTGINSWVKTAASYVTPVEGTSSAGSLDTFSYTSAAPLNLGAGPYTIAGDIGSYLVMLMEVQSTATQGVLSAETLTIAYDEL